MTDYLVNRALPIAINLTLGIGFVYLWCYLTGQNPDDVAAWVALGMAATAGVK